MSQRDIYHLPEKQKAQPLPWVRTGIRLGAGLILLGVVVAELPGDRFCRPSPGGPTR
jgi:hypothetical protein